MREIKFRAWDKKLKKMFPWEVIKLHDDPYFCDDEDYELTQYTGLKDKNGKEIYEGDILQANAIYEANIGIVFYDDGGYKITSDFSGIENYEVYDILNADLIEDNRLQIISNIYENPELLGGE